MQEGWPWRSPSCRQSGASSVARAGEIGVLDLVVVGGGGHVGLALALSFARAGRRVGIQDIAADTLERIGRGEVPFLEAGAEPLLREMLDAGLLELSSDPAMLGRTDVIVVVIGTPIDEFFNPAMTIFERALGQIAPHIRDGALVVLRSTVYPGTTEYVAQALADRGLRVDVAFCPERIAEGHALEELAHAAPDRGRRRSQSGRPRGRAVPHAWGHRSSGPAPARRSWPSSSPTPGAT